MLRITVPALYGAACGWPAWADPAAAYEARSFPPTSATPEQRGWSFGAVHRTEPSAPCPNSGWPRSWNARWETRLSVFLHPAFGTAHGPASPKWGCRFGPVDKSAIGYSMELRPMALRVLRRLTPGCFRVVRSFTIRFRFNAVAERRQCS